MMWSFREYHSRKHLKTQTVCLRRVYAVIEVWTSLGLNQGPPDYESVALTN